MKRVTVFETFDGAQHANETEAKRHLDRLYGDVLTRIVREVRSRSYSDAATWVDENTAALARLLEIKADIPLSAGEE